KREYVRATNRPIPQAPAAAPKRAVVGDARPASTQTSVPSRAQGRGREQKSALCVEWHGVAEEEFSQRRGDEEVGRQESECDFIHDSGSPRPCESAFSLRYC